MCLRFARIIMYSSLPLRFSLKSTIDWCQKSCLLYSFSRRFVPTVKPTYVQTSNVHRPFTHCVRTASFSRPANQIIHAGSSVPSRRFHLSTTTSVAQSHYKTLGVSHAASQQEVKAAFLRLSKQHHPDKNRGSLDSAEKFKKVSVAYDVIGDPEKRRIYDAELRAEFQREQEWGREQEDSGRFEEQSESKYLVIFKYVVLVHFFGFLLLSIYKMKK